MGKLRIRATGTRKETKNGRTIEIVTTEVDTRPDACKQCKQEPRMRSSSRCKKCSDAYHIQKMNDARLEKKIALELKSK
jgi:hypothetical protein